MRGKYTVEKNLENNLLIRCCTVFYLCKNNNKKKSVNKNKIFI